MSFDGPDQILPIFHHLMSFDGPKNLMSFDGSSISCLLMDPSGPSKDMSALFMIIIICNFHFSNRAFNSNFSISKVLIFKSNISSTGPMWCQNFKQYSTYPDFTSGSGNWMFKTWRYLYFCSWKMLLCRSQTIQFYRCYGELSKPIWV